MARKRTAAVLTVITAAFLVYMGIGFLIDPLGNATGFGLPEADWPGADASAFLNVKGGRDIGIGLTVLALLLARQPKATGWALLAMALMPVYDATVVLSYGGSLVAALSIHITAAAFVAVTGLLQLRVAAHEDRAAAQTEPGAAGERSATGG